MNRRLLEECVETMREEDCELTEARDFLKNKKGRLMKDRSGSLMARKSGFAIISASRSDEYFLPVDARRKLPHNRRRKKPLDIYPEVEVASRFGRIIPDRKHRTELLKQDLFNSGWEFRETTGGFASGSEVSGMEHGFIVYPFKYDHETHQKTVGSFASPEEEAENWHFFKQELLELGRKYRQWAVYFVEPKALQSNERMRHSDLQSSDIYDEAGGRVTRFGALNNQYYGARTSYKKKDVPFTNLRGRTGRTKATKASPNGLSAVDRQRLTDHSFVAFENPPKSRPKPRGWKRP